MAEAIVNHNPSSSLPSGCILMWSGAINSIPAGFALCNGENGTPDLRNRFIVGAGGNYGVGSTGGSDTVTLNSTQMPVHTHTLSLSGLTTNEVAADVYGLMHLLQPHYNSYWGHYDGYEEFGYLSDTTRDYDWSSSGGTYLSHERASSSETALMADITNTKKHSHSVTGSGTIGTSGSGSAHENRPPYYALCFIMKL